MIPRLLFGLGIGLAIAGLAFSMGLNTRGALIGSMLMLSSIVCGAVVIMMAKIPRRDCVMWNKPVVTALSVLFIIAMASTAASFVSMFKDYPWGQYAQSLTMFCLCIITLLLPRLQGKVYGS